MMVYIAIDIQTKLKMVVIEIIQGPILDKIRSMACLI